MKWIVGVDLRPFSRGALQLARWLGERRRGEGDRIVPVHVIEQEHLLAELRLRHLEEVLGSARDLAARALEQEDVAGLVPELRVVQGLRADESLGEVARAEHAGAVVIGRMAKRESHRIVRLGRVARRLLRSLPAPIVVVPPDLRAADVGDGPIVAMAGLREETADPCRFAQAIARHLGCRLTAIHVVPDPADAAPYGLPEELVAPMRRRALDQREAQLRAWLDAHRIEAQRTAVLLGNVLERAVAFAEQQRSPLLVVGTRFAEGRERVFAPSLARELAATATTPVAVVPMRA